jgi:ATP-binding protein involved in chromosome partitioning
MTIRETSDAGRPVVAIDPDGPHARIYRDMAGQVWGALTGGREPARRRGS